MRGHFQQRGNDSWRIKVFVGRDAAACAGTSSGPCGTRDGRPNGRSPRVVVEVDEGRHAPAAPMSFGELLDRWLDVKRRTVEASTLESYEWIARTYVRPRLAARKVASLRPIDLDELYERAVGPRAVASDGADLPHRDAPVAGAGAAMGPDRAQPCGRRDATAAPAGDHAADGRAGAGAHRRYPRRRSRSPRCRPRGSLGSSRLDPSRCIRTSRTWCNVRAIVLTARAAERARSLSRHATVTVQLTTVACRHAVRGQRHRAE